MKSFTKTSRNAPDIPFTKSRSHRVIAILFFSLLMLTQSCRKHDYSGPAFGYYDLKLVGDNFISPIGVVGSPDETKRLFVLDQAGKVWIINADGSKMPNPFIDLTSKLVGLSPFYDERGLLGIAFHPNFKQNRKFYVYYTAPPLAGGPEHGASWSSQTRISEFKASQGDPNRADINSEKIILEANHPQSNHNGGTIAFGPDGYLYISIGDGGNGDDIGPGHVDDWYKANAGGNGQDVVHNLLGNILRIDVNTGNEGRNYSIPSDNPFANGPGEDEIYAYGFRNPYRFSFDMGGSHQLYAGDAGQSLYEEIDVVERGGNYGWNVKEGTHCFSTDNDLEERASCPVADSAGNPLLDPVIEVKNSANPAGGETIAIVGGNVYRGSSIPALSGKYLFGFLSEGFGAATGKVMISKQTPFGLWSYEPLKLKSFPDNLGQYLKGFGQSQDGEIYVTTSEQIGPQGATGKVYKLIFVR
ncbi:MAG: PQQ-dependent sugar dehydrogenase [Ginsengibacter sp.]